MTDPILKKTRFADGLWEGLLIDAEEQDDGSPPRLTAASADLRLPAPELTPTGTPGRWRVRQAIPAAAMGDGAAVVSLDLGDRTLARVVVICPDPEDGDPQAEIAVLRAELDMVKAVLRRHLRTSEDRADDAGAAESDRTAR